MTLSHNRPTLHFAELSPEGLIPLVRKPPLHTENLGLYLPPALLMTGLTDPETYMYAQENEVKAKAV